GFMSARRPHRSRSGKPDIRNARKDTRLASRVKTKPRARKPKKSSADAELEALAPPPRVLRLDLLLLAVVLVFVLLGWHFFPMDGESADAGTVAELPVPPEMAAKAEEASAHFAGGDLESAARCYEDIILHHKDNLFAWSNLGVVRYQQKEYQEASYALEQAVRLNPQDAFSHSLLGIVYYHMGRRPAAIESLQRSVGLKQDDPMTLNYLGMALSQEGKRGVAERLLRQAVALVPHYGDAHYNLAVALLLKDDPEPDAADQHYRRALELGVPESPTFEELLDGLRRSQQQARNAAG
ncbi:MAG: tetratricopeptide repeat protein, partial [Verrucomicrobiota bacterium]